MFQSNLVYCKNFFHYNLYLKLSEFYRLSSLVGTFFDLLRVQFYPKIKRLLDIIISALLLILLMPIFLITSICIKCTDFGPILYWQKRIGYKGKLFNFPKFRSMIMNADSKKQAIAHKSHHQSSITFKMKNDPRVTWIGKYIRKLSIDEFPQFYSVLIGDMTLIGPRPCLPKEAAKYTLTERQRLESQPGLSCIWQISGRADIPFDQQFLMDIDYINNRSLSLDFKILVLTIPAVVFGKGAY